VILPNIPQRRLAGKTKYTLERMLHLAQDAIFSFSTVPLRLALIAGFLVLLLAMVLLFYIFFVVITRAVSSLVSGWTTLMVGIMLIGGVQLVMIGLQGYYIGMIFKEIKRRSTFILRDPMKPSEPFQKFEQLSTHEQESSDNLA
jgi:hypothetical protein